MDPSDNDKLIQIHEDVRSLREEVSALTNQVRELRDQWDREQAAREPSAGVKISRPVFVNGYLNVREALERKGVPIEQDEWNALLVSRTSFHINLHIFENQYPM